MKLLFSALTIPFAFAWAEVPVPHSGHVSVDGTPFTGSGSFKFSIVNASDSVIWSNDGSTAQPPTSSIQLTVNNGFYSLHLGDTSLTGMSALPASSLREVEKAYLRIWFDEGDGAFERIGTDVALGAAPFALVSELSRGSPEIEARLTELENLVQSLPAANIDPLLLAEVGYRKFSSRELSGLSLPGVDFSNADFTGATISMANLDDSECPNAEFEKAVIRDSNFSNANLVTSNMSQVRIFDSLFLGINASGASLSNADVNGSVFSSGLFVNADLNEAVFKECDFSNANLQGTSLIGTDFSGCVLSSANLTSADGSATDFSGCNLTGATLSGQFPSSSFQGSILTGADFSGSDLTQADFTGATGFDASSYSNVTFFETILPDGTVRTD